MSGMDPSKISSLSVDWSGTQPLLEEHPSKMTTAIRLFLQGLGYGGHALREGGSPCMRGGEWWPVHDVTGTGLEL